MNLVQVDIVRFCEEEKMVLVADEVYQVSALLPVVQLLFP